MNRRAGVGPGWLLQLRVGASVWDHLLLTAGFGYFSAADRRPVDEVVVNCIYRSGTTECWVGNEPDVLHEKTTAQSSRRD